MSPMYLEIITVFTEEMYENKTCMTFTHSLSLISFTNKWIVWLRVPMSQFTLLVVDLLFHYRGIRWPYFIPGALIYF